MLYFRDSILKAQTTGHPGYLIGVTRPQQHTFHLMNPCSADKSHLTSSLSYKWITTVSIPCILMSSTKQCRHHTPLLYMVLSYATHVTIGLSWFSKPCL